MLQNAEADFRFKFRQLLEGYLKQIGAYDAAARERAGEFARRVEELKGAIASGGATEELSAADSEPAAEVAEPEEEMVPPTPLRPAAAVPESAEPRWRTRRPSRPSPRPRRQLKLSRPWRPKLGARRRTRNRALRRNQQPRPAQELFERPWWEPMPAESEETGRGESDDGHAARAATREEDTAAPQASADEEPVPVPEEPQERSQYPEDDEFLSDVDDTVGDDEFKW